MVRLKFLVTVTKQRIRVVFNRNKIRGSRFRFFSSCRGGVQLRPGVALGFRFVPCEVTRAEAKPIPTPKAKTGGRLTPPLQKSAPRSQSNTQTQPGRVVNPLPYLAETGVRPSRRTSGENLDIFVGGGTRVDGTAGWDQCGKYARWVDGVLRIEGTVEYGRLTAA